MRQWSCMGLVAWLAAWRGVDKGRNPQSACIWLSVSSTAEFDGNAPCTRVRRHANPWVCPRPPSCLSRSRVRGMARCREDRPRNDVSLSPSPRCSRPGSKDGPRQPPICGACAACVGVVSHDGMAKLPWPSIRPANKVLEPPGACGKNQKGDSRGSMPSVQRLSTEPSLEREALGKTPKRPSLPRMTRKIFGWSPQTLGVAVLLRILVKRFNR